MENQTTTPARIHHWFSGSIRRRLTFFIMIVCLFLISLMWFLGTILLQPAYYSSIRRDLQATLTGIISTIEQAQQDSLPITQPDPRTFGGQKTLSDECVLRLHYAIETGFFSVNECSIDIADSQYQNLFWIERNSYLHPITESGGKYETSQRLENNVFVTLLRKSVFEEGTLFKIFPEEQLVVVGSTTSDGQYAVIVATNTGRIPQAAGILKKLMGPVFLASVCISIILSAIFSHWFTRPLRRLSSAAKEMAKGNYDISVAEEGDDEITDLSRDFNSMAREVKRSAELQRDLIANVSHDLRTPLTLIKGYAETVRDLTGDNPEKRQEQLSVIIDEADRLSHLVGSVMELSRMSSGNEKLQMVRFDIGELCDEVLFRYEALCQQNNWQLDFQTEGSFEIQADPALLERALHNLVSNAIHHIGPDGYIGLHITQKGQAVRVQVIDHGQGIAPEELPLIFERYYRSRADSGKPGTGLGLSITKEIFLAHKFLYGVESVLGSGSTFWFEAPLCPSPKTRSKE